MNYSELLSYLHHSSRFISDSSRIHLTLLLYSNSGKWSFALFIMHILEVYAMIKSWLKWKKAKKVVAVSSFCLLYFAPLCSMFQPILQINIFERQKFLATFRNYEWNYEYSGRWSLWNSRKRCSAWLPTQRYSSLPHSHATAGISLSSFMSRRTKF